MRHLLLVDIKGFWKQIFSGGYGTDSYEKCIHEARKLDDDESWMIVQEKRAYIGTHIDKFDEGDVIKDNLSKY